MLFIHYKWMDGIFLVRTSILLILWSFKFITEKKILKSHQSTGIWSRYLNIGSSSFSLLPCCPEVRHYFILFFDLMCSWFMLSHHCSKGNGSINHEPNFKTCVSLKISVLFLQAMQNLSLMVRYVTWRQQKMDPNLSYLEHDFLRYFVTVIEN